jgi:hypothetical protein
MIPSPKLDDRAFDDIVAEAIRLIPRYAPEWTNHNVSDPGITLIELAAWMTDVILWLIFPLAWIGLTLIRGAVDGWYPYPFLDPDAGGYRSVGYHVIAILAGFVVIAGLTVALGDWGRDRRLRQARSGSASGDPPGGRGVAEPS